MTLGNEMQLDIVSRYADILIMSDISPTSSVRNNRMSCKSLDIPEKLLRFTRSKTKKCKMYANSTVIVVMYGIITVCLVERPNRQLLFVLT